MSKGQLFPQPNPGSAVSGPNVAVNGDIAQFDGTSGKAIKDGGLSLDTDVTMAANSDTRIASQKASKAYADAKAPATRLINTTAPLAGGGDLSADRTLTVAAATGAALGVVKPDGTTITISGGVISAVASGGGATAGVYAFGPDVVPAVPKTIDDEFDAALNFASKWSWFNQGTSSAGVSKSYLGLLGVAENSNTLRGIYQAIPAGNWTIAAKITNNNYYVNFPDMGLFLYESATNKLMSIRITVEAGAPIVNALSVSGWNAGGVGIAAGGFTNNISVTTLYVAIQYDGTKYTFYYSIDGANYVQVQQELITAHFTTKADKIGLYANSGFSSKVPVLGCDWIRQIA